MKINLVIIALAFLCFAGCSKSDETLIAEAKKDISMMSHAIYNGDCNSYKSFYEKYDKSQADTQFKSCQTAYQLFTASKAGAKLKGGDFEISILNEKYDHEISSDGKIVIRERCDIHTEMTVTLNGVKINATELSGKKDDNDDLVYVFEKDGNKLKLIKKQSYSESEYGAKKLSTSAPTAAKTTDGLSTTTAAGPTGESKSQPAIDTIDQNSLKDATISASSTVPATTKYNYDPKNMIDGDTKTSWCGKGNKGNWVEVKFSKSVKIANMSMIPGYGGNQSAFVRNNRVKSATITLSDGKTIKANFADKMDFQDVSIGAETASVKLTIDEVYPGKDNDVCIGEISFK